MIKQCACLLVFAAAGYALGQAADSTWQEMLRASGYAESARAGFRQQCNVNPRMVVTPQLRSLCAKIDEIPSRVIEGAALPCVKRYVSAQAADELRLFWDSDSGRALRGKITREIETGQYNVLTAADLKLLGEQSKTGSAQAMLAFTKDSECSSNVARALLAYEP